MGEVYEAEDLELGERIALKTIGPAFAYDEKMLERFRQEVLLARKVTHPNVCRIFDVFHHESASQNPAREAGSSITFLTMELLEGETLTQRLGRAGPLRTSEALPIVEQLAEGLAAAHRVGIVHRDFKSSNVTLAPSPTGLRAVITDFGLAGGIGGEDRVQARESEGQRMGTPRYMAPEQVSGGAISAATDIYGLGVVIYEMVTGALPFVGENPHDTAFKRLREPPTPPRQHVPGLDPRWERTILRCLERDPAARFATAAEVAAALRSEPSHQPRARRWAFPLVSIGLLAALAAALLLGRGGSREPPAPAKAVQLTTSAGLDLFPAFSPDARRLAYSSNRTGGFQIHLRELEPGHPERQLTADDGENLQPTWAPDGTRLAYHSKRHGGIWTIAPNRAAPGRLTSFGSRPAWSPDGRQIAFQSDAASDLAANASPAMPPSTLWIVSAEGGEPRQITQVGTPEGGHGTPSWAPGGGRIAFGSYDRNRSAIWTVRPDGSGLTQLVEGKQIFDPVFAADGESVVYAATTASGDYGMFRVRLSSATGQPRGRPERIAAVALGTVRSLAPDGTEGRIAYSALTMASNLWSLPLSPAAEATGEPRPLTSETGRNSRPAFSPDGRRVAFERWQPGTNPDIWLMEASGRDARPLTTHPAVDSVPTWSPDGSRVVFFSDRGGHGALWAVEISSGQESRELSLEQRMEFPRLSPDGKRLAFGSQERGDTNNLWVVSLDAGEPRQLTFDEESIGYPCWSPDGRLIAGQMRRGEDSHVVIVPSDGGRAVQLTNEPGQSWAYSFSPDGARIAFSGFRGGFWNIWWVSKAGDAERPLTAYTRPNAYVRYPTWSPRGEQIVYEYAETHGNIWLLEGLN